MLNRSLRVSAPPPLSQPEGRKAGGDAALLGELTIRHQARYWGSARRAGSLPQDALEAHLEQRPAHLVVVSHQVLSAEQLSEPLLR